MNILLVAIGGAIGAVLRYILSLAPLKTDYPILTLITNMLGAILIGFAAGLFSTGKISKEQNLLLKTGVCGGFTTFSTFSLESLTLIENGKMLSAFSYMALSLVLCVICVFIGRYAALMIKGDM